jgi:hypothetical protein
MDQGRTFTKISDSKPDVSRRRPRLRLLEDVKKNLREIKVNALNAELNPICHLLALLGVHHFLHVSRIRVKSLTLRILMSYIYIYIYIYTIRIYIYI